MQQSEFDKFADEYRSQHAANIRASGESPEFFSEYKVRDILHWVTRRTTRSIPSRILDFGGGIGNSLPFLRKYFPGTRITCLDVSRRSLEIARERFPGAAEFVHFDGVNIPTEDSSFDICLAACVFHHIPRVAQAGLLAELRRVTKPTGILALFEHNPWNPVTRKVVRDCVFDENAVLISAPEMRRRISAAGFESVRVRYRIFFPGSLAALRPLEPLLTPLPLGAQYCVFATPSQHA